MENTSTAAPGAPSGEDADSQKNQSATAGGGIEKHGATPSTVGEPVFYYYKISNQFNVEVSNIPSDEKFEGLLQELRINKQVEGDWHVEIRHAEKHASFRFESEESALGVLKSKGKCIEVEEHTIDNQEDYITFIKKLRATLANHNEGRDDIFWDGPRKECPEMAHSLLTRVPSGGNPLDMFIYIKIAVKGGNEEEVPILAIQKDNVYIKGFMNKNNQWFELPAKTSKVQHLKKGLGAMMLEGWNETYSGTMKLERGYQVDSTLMSARFGRAFAKRALHRLWNYDPEINDDNPTRHGLAGLFVMISEAARMDPFLPNIADSWSGETGLTEELAEMRREWGHMSAALLKWKKSSYRDWPSGWKYRVGDALKSVRLVREAKYVSGPATWVEIFSASANPPAKSIKITGEGDVFPSENAQGPREMNHIHGINIAAHDWFCISVDYGDGSTTRQFKLPCSEQDSEPVTASFNCGDKKLDVTYMVMSDAVKATVNVNLLVLKGVSKDAGKLAEKDLEGDSRKQEIKYIVRGGISASIGDNNKHKIMLLSPGEEREIMADNLTLKMERGHVMVPPGKQLHIYMEHLVITDHSNNNIIVGSKNCQLTFECSSPTAKSDGNSDDVRVGVGISWDKDIRRWDPETDKNTWTIGDTEQFTKFINGLRADIGSNKASDKKVFDIPVLKRHATLPETWTTHVKVQVEGENKSSIDLAIREDILFAAGFKNQAGVWYSLTSLGGDKLLGPNYNPVCLNWGRSYADLLENNKVKELMKKLGKKFAGEAVRTLSRYPDVEEEDDLHIRPRLALLGLMFMVCESTIWRPLQRYFEEIWDTKVCDAPQQQEDKLSLLTCCICSWDVVSYALRIREASGKSKEADLSKENLEEKVWVELLKRFRSKEDAKEAIKGIQLVFGYH